jgi:hypothetical protein
MKNLNKTLLIITISFFTHNLFSQGMYVAFDVGYSSQLGFASRSNFKLDFYSNSGFNLTDVVQEQIIIENDNGYIGQTSTYSISIVNYSLGKGFNFGGTFGYMFNKYLGAEIGLSYLIGAKAQAEQIVNRTVTSPDGTTKNSFKKTTTLSSNMFRIIPAIVFKAGFEKVNPYGRFGLIFGIGSAEINIDDDIPFIGLATEGRISTEKLSGGLAFGFDAAVGVEFKLNERIGLFGEFSFINLNYSPNKGEIIEYKNKTTGEDLLPELNTWNKETEFVDTIVFENNGGFNPLDETKPKEDFKFTLPYSSWGINIGVIINF